MDVDLVVGLRSLEFRGEMWAGDRDLVSTVHRVIENLELKTSLSESKWREEVPEVLGLAMFRGCRDKGGGTSKGD